MSKNTMAAHGGKNIGTGSANAITTIDVTTVTVIVIMMIVMMTTNVVTESRLPGRIGKSLY